MSLTYPPNTLAYHRARVLCATRDMRAVPCKKVAMAVNSFMSSDMMSGAVPEREALWFYGMNHGVALISQRRASLEPLGTWEQGFLQAYHKELGPKAVRAFYYLLLICTREARHNLSLKEHAPWIVNKFGKAVADFFLSIKGGEKEIWHALLNTPPDCTIGAYVGSLRWVFDHCKWHKAYGGPKWGRVADCLSKFVHGVYSAEMMLDTVWTLAHNGGPIFNKGMLYSMYNKTNLLRILDVQRSGQIPELILTDNMIVGYVDSSLKGWMANLQAEFPGQIGHVVDKGKVKPVSPTKSVFFMGGVALKPSIIGVKSVPVAGTFLVMPGSTTHPALYVEKIKRAA